MANKDVLKESTAENWSVQFSRNKGGVMINSRGNSVEEVYKNYVQACSLLDNEVQEAEQVKSSAQLEVPFYNDGIEPYTKRDGSTGYEIEKGKVPHTCPICKADGFEIENGRFGKYWLSNCKDKVIVRIKK